MRDELKVSHVVEGNDGGCIDDGLVSASIQTSKRRLLGFPGLESLLTLAM